MNLHHNSQGFLAIFRFYITHCIGYCLEMSTLYFWYFPQHTVEERAFKQSAFYLQTVDIS